MSNLLIGTEQIGTFTSGLVDCIGHVVCDTFSDLPTSMDYSSTGVKLVMGSVADIIDTGDRYKMDSNGVWMIQPAPTSYTTTVTLDLTGYYTSAQTDSAIAAALNYEMLNTFDNRYARIGTGSTIADGTDLNTLTTVGKYRNGNANNGCTNTPENLVTPFTLLVENTYNAARYRQTWYGGQQYTIGFFYQRTSYTSGGLMVWSPWYKFTGTAV